MAMTIGSEAKKTKTQHKSPCHDCPWRRNAIPGWLGSMTVEQWITAAHGESMIDCHTTDKQCAGAAIFRANICKSTRSPAIIKLPPDRATVFSWDNEFAAHHGDAKIAADRVLKPKPQNKPRQNKPEQSKEGCMRCEDCGGEYTIGAPHFMFCPARTCDKCGKACGHVLPVYDSRTKPPTRWCDDCLCKELDREEAGE